MRRIAIVCLFVVVAVSLAGCVTGPGFVEEQTIPDGKAEVYLYRPIHLYGDVITPMIMTNEGFLTLLDAGGYYSYITNAGTLRFWAVSYSASLPITVEAVAGQKYYVKIGFAAETCTLTLVPQETAKTDIAYCRRVQ
ncbi:MAG: hypothetical protein ABSF77_06525 [Spirochaetia bacterium]|jgi:hypothetical protein